MDRQGAVDLTGVTLIFATVDSSRHASTAESLFFWAWVDGKGRISIDLANGSATLVVPSKRHFEALGWNLLTDRLFLAAQNKLWVWDPTTLAFTLFATNLPGPVLGLNVRFPDGFLVLGVAKQQKILVWDPSTKTTVGNIPTPGFKPIQSLAQTFPCQQGG